MTKTALVLVAVTALTACGGDPPKVENEGQGAGEAAEQRAPRSNGMGVSQELGSLDKEKTNAAFEALTPQLQGCFTKGIAKLPFLSGEVKLVVRITEAGSVKYAYVKESTLGDRDVEDCMLGVARSASWPKPKDGEGIAERDMNFDPGGDERPPVAWTADKIASGLAKAKGALGSCKSSSGTPSIAVTMYVGTNGKAQAVGVASGDEKGEKAAACVVSALRGVSFPSPGSWPAKVSFSVD